MTATGATGARPGEGDGPLPDRGSRRRSTLVRATIGAVVLAVAVAAILAGGALGVSVGEPASTGYVGETSTPDGPDAAANDTRLLHEGDALALESGPGRAVRGRTDLPPGTELTVRVRSTDADHPYLRSSTTVVDASGAFRAVFDLSEVPPDTQLSVLVHRGGANLTSATGEVVECDDCPVAPPARPSAVVDDDGQVTLTNAPGQVIHGRTNLPPGTELTLSVQYTGGDLPFIRQAATLVDASGAFRAVFDLNGPAPAGDLSVSVVHNGTTLTTASGSVDCAGDCPSATPTRDEYANAAVGVTQVTNGSVARIRVDLGRADVATLAVGGPGVDYALEVDVRDGSGDDSVEILLDTAAANSDGRTVAVADDGDDGDDLRVGDEHGRLTATEYRLQLHPVADRSTTVVTGLLVVTQAGDTGTPLLTPATGSGLPLGSTAALLLGAVLAVAGVAFLLGLIEL